MAVLQVNGSAVTATSTVNDGGVMKGMSGREGAVLSSNSTAGNYGDGVFASTVVSGVNTTVALSGGEFAHDHNPPIGYLLTEELAGLASSALAGAPSDAKIALQPLQQVNTRLVATAIRDNQFDYYEGVWESGYPQTQTDTFPTDSGALSVREFPGSLTFRTGAPVPADANYSEKTG